MSPVTDFSIQPVSTPPLVGDGTGTPLRPIDDTTVERTALAEAPDPATPVRQRRPYQVWERDTLPSAETGHERWFVIADAVDAPSRSVAREMATGGRPGTFATVLIGEFVEEVVDDPQVVIAQALASEMFHLIGAEALRDAGVSEEDIRNAARAALLTAGEAS